VRRTTATVAISDASTKKCHERNPASPAAGGATGSAFARVLVVVSLEEV
jgi:hypothetical protein